MARETDDTHLTRAPAAEDTRSDGERAEPVTPRALLVRRLGLAAGVLLAVTVYLLMPGEVPHPAKLTAATAVLMAVWWMTEALPIPATALVPLVLFPVLSPEVGLDDVGASYGNNIIFQIGRASCRERVQIPQMARPFKTN